MNLDLDLDIDTDEYPFPFSLEDFEFVTNQGRSPRVIGDTSVFARREIGLANDEALVQVPVMNNNEALQQLVNDLIYTLSTVRSSIDNGDISPEVKDFVLKNYDSSSPVAMALLSPPVAMALQPPMHHEILPSQYENLPIMEEQIPPTQNFIFYCNESNLAKVGRPDKRRNNLTKALIVDAVEYAIRYRVHLETITPTNLVDQRLEFRACLVIRVLSLPHFVVFIKEVMKLMNKELDEGYTDAAIKQHLQPKYIEKDGKFTMFNGNLPPGPGIYITCCTIPRPLVFG